MQFRDENFDVEPEVLRELYSDAFNDRDGNSNIMEVENRRSSSLSVQKREMASVFSRSSRRKRSKRSKRTKSRKNRSRK